MYQVLFEPSVHSNTVTANTVVHPVTSHQIYHKILRQKSFLVQHTASSSFLILGTLHSSSPLFTPLLSPLLSSYLHSSSVLSPLLFSPLTFNPLLSSFLLIPSLLFSPLTFTPTLLSPPLCSAFEGILAFNTLPSAGHDIELSFAIIGDLGDHRCRILIHSMEHPTTFISLTCLALLSSLSFPRSGQTVDSAGTVAHILGTPGLSAVLHAGEKNRFASELHSSVTTFGNHEIVTFELKHQVIHRYSRKVV